MAFRNINVIIGANTVGLQAGLRSAAAQLSSFVSQLNAAAGAANAAGARLGGAGAAAAAGVNNLHRGMGAGINQMGRYNAAMGTGSRIMAAMAAQTGLASKAMAGMRVAISDTIGVFAGFLAINTMIRGITNSIRFLVDSFMDFDKQMVNSTAIMGDLSATMTEDLAEGARKVAEITTFSSAEAAKGLYFIASAGFDAASSLEALPVAARFAQAGLLDLAKATEYLMDVTTAFGGVSRDSITGLINADETVEEMTRISDVITEGAVISNATIDQLSASLTNKAAGAARLLGIEVEETTAALAAFASVGIKGQVAGTQYAMVLRDLQKAFNKNSETFRSLGVNVYDAQGNFNSLSDILMSMNSAFSSMSDQQVRATLTMMGFQDRSLGAMMAIMDMGGQIDIYEAALHRASGATEEISEKQLKSLSARLTLLKNQVGNFATVLGKNLVEGAEAIWEVIGPGIEATGATVLAFAKNFLTIAEAVGGPVAAALGGLIKGLTAVGGALSGFANTVSFGVVNQGSVAMVAAALAAKHLAMWMGSKLPTAANIYTGSIIKVNAATTALGTRVQHLGTRFFVGGGMLSGFGMKLLVLGSQMRASTTVITAWAQRMAAASAVAGTWQNRLVGLGSGIKRFAQVGMMPAFILIGNFVQQMQEAKAASDAWAQSLVEGIDLTSIEGVHQSVDIFNEQLDRSRDKLADYVDGVGSAASSTLGMFGQLASFGMYDSGYDEAITDVQALNEQLEKQERIVNNIANARNDLAAMKFYAGTSDDFIPGGKGLTEVINNTVKLKEAKRDWESLNQIGEYSDQVWYKTAQSIGLNLDQYEKLEDIAPELRKQWMESLAGIEYNMRFGMDTTTEFTDMTGEAFDQLVEKSEAAEKDIAKMFAGMSSASDAYRDSMIETVDVQTIWSDLVSETTDAYNEAQQSAAEAARDSADGRAEAIMGGADDAVDSMEIAKREELDALEDAKNAEINAYEDITDDQRDAINRSFEDRKQAIEDGYNSNIEATREGAKNQAEAARDSVGDPDNADTIIPSAQEFLGSLNKRVADYQTYLGRINELAARGASTDLIDMFMGMDPAEGQALIDDILSQTGNFVDEFNATLSELGKIDNTISWEILEANMEDKLNNMGEFSNNAMKISNALNMSIEDVLKIGAEMEKGGIDPSEAFASITGEIDSGNVAEVKKLFDQWSTLGSRTIAEGAVRFTDSLTLMDAAMDQDIGIMKSAMKELDPEVFFQELMNMGFDDTIITQIRDNFKLMLKDMEGESLASATRIVMMLNNELAQYAWNPAANAFQRVDAGFGMSMGAERKVFADGGFNFPERHTAQIARAGDMRVWAEPETGGEAYIPLGGSKRAQSTEILSEVARRFGYGLYKFDSGGFWRAQASAMVTQQQAQVVVVPVTTTNNYQFGDIQGVRMEDAAAYAKRMERQRNLTT